jgi:hypothetical protein
VSVSFTLTGNYAFSFNAQGMTYADAFNFQNSTSDSSVNLPGIGGSSAGSSWDSTGGNGWAGHNFNTGTVTGILSPGTYSFDARVDGNTYNTGSFSSGHFGSFGNFIDQTYPVSADFSLTLTPLPEPASMTLLGVGLLTLAGYGWRRRQVAS